VSRPGGLFLRKGRRLSAGREAVRDGLKLGPLRPALRTDTAFRRRVDGIGVLTPAHDAEPPRCDGPVQ
jgi:hypothetical protein